MLTYAAIQVQVTHVLEGVVPVLLCIACHSETGSLQEWLSDECSGSNASRPTQSIEAYHSLLRLPRMHSTCCASPGTDCTFPRACRLPSSKAALAGCAQPGKQCGGEAEAGSRWAHGLQPAQQGLQCCRCKPPCSAAALSS